MTRILGLIPARGGSKGIPQKNIYPLLNKPLLSYTCNAALDSKYLDRVVLSTDSEDIASVGKSCGVEVPFSRPEDLSGDKTPSIDVVLHALEWFKQNDNYLPDGVVLLQPTSPLRRSKHIDEAIEIFKQQDVDTVVSVVPVDHRYSPYSIMTLENGLLNDFWQEPLPFDKYQRQNLPTLYARNGPAVLITRTSVLIEKQSFYGETVKPYIMKEQHSVDIDSMLDIQIAECLLNCQEKQD